MTSQVEEVPHISLSLPETKDNAHELDWETRAPSGNIVLKLNDIFAVFSEIGTEIEDVPSNPQVVLLVHNFPTNPAAHAQV